jgi:hypothetical protein
MRLALVEILAPPEETARVGQNIHHRLKEELIFV